MMQVVNCMMFGCTRHANGDLLIADGAKLPLCEIHGFGQPAYRPYSDAPKRNPEDEIQWPVSGQLSVTLERRFDGGLRVFSDDIPGLHLSGPDGELVLSDLYRAISILTTHNEPSALEPKE